MDLLESPLAAEISAITNAPQYTGHHQWKCTIHAGATDIEALYVHSYGVIRNYSMAFSDEIVVDAALGAGDYLHVVYPNRSVLEITMTKIPLAINAQFTPTLGNVNSVRYKAQIYQSGSEAIEGNIPGAENHDQFNNMFIKPFKFQLIHPAIDYLRKTTISGVLQTVVCGDAIRAFLGKYTREFTNQKGLPFAGVDLYAGSNPAPRDAILIPDHTPIINIPAIIDHECGGVYPAGFWYYFQNNMWYIYPTMDTSRYRKSQRTLNVINVPNGRLPDAERTFRITPTQVILLATGKTHHHDPSERRQLQQGNATRFVDPKTLLNDSVTVVGNRAIADRSKTMSEVVSDPRADGSNFVTLSDNSITSKAYKEYSKLAFRSGQFIQCVWENGDIDLIYPGMPTKYSYISNASTVVELTGIVVGTQLADMPVTNNIAERKFKSVIALTLFLSKN